MRLALAVGAAATLLVATVGESLANVQFGRPDFSNFLSRPQTVTCDWQYENYFRACPTPHPPPKPEQPPTHKTGKS